MRKRPRKRGNLVPKMYRDYRRGLSLEQLAKKYGCSRQHIHKTFRKLGLELRPPGCRWLLPCPINGEFQLRQWSTGYFLFGAGRHRVKAFPWRDVELARCFAKYFARFEQCKVRVFDRAAKLI